MTQKTITARLTFDATQCIDATPETYDPAPDLETLCTLGADACNLASVEELTPTLVVVWRIDGDLMFTHIPQAARPPEGASADDWVKVAIREEYESHAFDESEIQELIDAATNSDAEGFRGSEITAIIETPAPITYIM